MSSAADLVMPGGHAADGGPPAREPIQIVPVKALPIVGLILVALIAAIQINTFWSLEFFHVVGGGLWTGIDLFVGLVLGPIIGRMSIPARAEFTAKFMPKMVVIMPTVVVMTLAAGFQLALKYGNLNPGSINHGWLVVSMCVVGVMAAVALGILEPANIAVLFEMNKPEPNGEIIAKLMQRFVYTAGITGVMQLATLFIMTRVASH